MVDTSRGKKTSKISLNYVANFWILHKRNIFRNIKQKIISQENMKLLFSATEKQKPQKKKRNKLPLFPSAYSSCEEKKIKPENLYDISVSLSVLPISEEIF